MRKLSEDSSPASAKESRRPHRLRNEARRERYYRRCSRREVGWEAVLVAVVAGVSFQPQWLQAKSSWGLGLVANSPQRGHFIVHMVDLPVMVR